MIAEASDNRKLADTLDDFQKTELIHTPLKDGPFYLRRALRKQAVKALLEWTHSGITAEEVTPDLVKRFHAFERNTSRKPRSSQRELNRFLCHVAPDRFVPLNPPTRTKHRRLTIESPDQTLADFFGKYDQQVLKMVPKSKRFVERLAVKRYLEFIRSDITFSKITVASVEQFNASLDDKDETHRGFRSALYSVLRYADPDSWGRVVVQERRRTMKPAELLVEGSILKFFEEIYRPLRLRGKSARTVRSYRDTLTKFGLFLGRIPLLTDIDDDVVARFLLWIRETRGNAAPTANKDRSQLLAIANVAGRRGLSKFLAVPPENEPDRIPQAWSKEQLAALLDACKSAPGRIGRVEAWLWWTAIHLTIWDTGERITAVLRLTWGDLDFADRWLLARAEIRKGNRRDKQFRLHEKTVDVLKQLRAALEKAGEGCPTDPIFPWPYYGTYIWFRYAKILEAAGLPTDRKSKFHRIRRSVASHAEAAGGNATALLDHAHRQTTQAYLDPKIVGQQHAIDLLFRPDEKGGAQ